VRSRWSPLSVAVALLAALPFFSACTVAGKKNVIEGAMADDASRKDAFEATARVLDEHPEYVDELNAVTRRHPRLRDRLIENTARDLQDPALAATTAERLAQNPASLEQIMTHVIDATMPRPEARAAFEEAMRERSRQVNDMVTESPDVLASQLQYTLANVEHRPRAREVFLTTMSSSADALARILARDPDALARIARAIANAEARDPSARKRLIERFLHQRPPE
jgi:hypothetical protein